jgi:hypothetical protein
VRREASSASGMGSTIAASGKLGPPSAACSIKLPVGAHRSRRVVAVAKHCLALAAHCERAPDEELLDATVVDVLEQIVGNRPERFLAPAAALRIASSACRSSANAAAIAGRDTRLGVRSTTAEATG